SSYKVGLSRNLKQHGVHDIFHSSLLQIHISSDDQLFPGRSDTQVWDFGEPSLDHVHSHSGSKHNALFKIVWKSGDITWLPYDKVEHLTALDQYFEVLGIEGVDQLQGNETQLPLTSQ
ncbi:hypothetical protein AN958_10082, partial [Leucoagaricus sp. SymC.cos]